MRTIAHYIVSILLLLSLIVLVPLSEAAKTRSIIYVKSDNISHIVLQERLDLCLQLLVQELKLEGKPLPTILVVHVSAREAGHAGLARTSVKLRLNTDPDRRDQPYYELWLAGEPAAEEYTVAMFSLLDDCFRLHPEPVAQKQVIARVVRYLKSTVNVRVR